MQAIEISTKVDSKGNLNISLPISFKKQKVKVIIMYNQHEDEENWLSDLKKNASFDFLNNVEEDIYSTKDGKPFHAK